MNNYAIIIPLIVVVTVGLIETILVAKWNPFYFEKMLSKYTQTIPFYDEEKAKLGLIHFINHLDTTKGLKKYKGIMADDHTFYFRKKMVSSRRNNFDDVHGSITIDSENRQIVFKSRIGISYILAFCYLFYIFVFLDGFGFSAAIIFSFIIVLICLISLAVERRIYKKMIDEITRVITNY